MDSSRRTACAIRERERGGAARSGLRGVQGLGQAGGGRRMTTLTWGPPILPIQRKRSQRRELAAQKARSRNLSSEDMHRDIGHLSRRVHKRTHSARGIYRWLQRDGTERAKRKALGKAIASLALLPPSRRYDHLQSVHVQSVRETSRSTHRRTGATLSDAAAERMHAAASSRLICVVCGVSPPSDGVCLLSRRYHQSPKSKKFLLGQQKLMWGLLYSLKDFVNQLAPKTSATDTADKTAADAKAQCSCSPRRRRGGGAL